MSSCVYSLTAIALFTRVAFASLTPTKIGALVKCGQSVVRVRESAISGNCVSMKGVSGLQSGRCAAWSTAGSLPTTGKRGTSARGLVGAHGAVRVLNAMPGQFRISVRSTLPRSACATHLTATRSGDQSEIPTVINTQSAHVRSSTHMASLSPSEMRCLSRRAGVVRSVTKRALCISTTATRAEGCAA